MPINTSVKFGHRQVLKTEVFWLMEIGYDKGLSSISIAHKRLPVSWVVVTKISL